MPSRYATPGIVLLGALVGILVSDFFMGTDEGPSRLAEGEVLYIEHCLTCHQASGGGVPFLQPPLAGSDLANGEARSLIQYVLAPPNAPGSGYENTMPPFEMLTDIEVALVLTYVRASFGNDASMVSEALVTRVRGGE